MECSASVKVGISKIRSAEAFRPSPATQLMLQIPTLASVSIKLRPPQKCCPNLLGVKGQRLPFNLPPIQPLTTKVLVLRERFRKIQGLEPCVQTAIPLTPPSCLLYPFFLSCFPLGGGGVSELSHDPFKNYRKEQNDSPTYTLTH